MYSGGIASSGVVTRARLHEALATQNKCVIKSEIMSNQRPLNVACISKVSDQSLEKLKHKKYAKPLKAIFEVLILWKCG